MDEISRYNRARWNDLARANVVFSRPWLALDERQARLEVDPHGFIGDAKGKEVLCLAAAGGQQSVAFALLGARVTVLDLSDEMLNQDRRAAAHYGFSIRHEQGDMRDLSRFSSQCFDVVWQAFSINFVPDVAPVFDEVERVLKPGGIYQTQFHNPYIFGVDERSWNGRGYQIGLPYIEGQQAPDLPWDVYGEDGSYQEIQGPQEFRHTMSTMLNGLIARGLVLLAFDENAVPSSSPEPGSWDHFLAVCVPLMSAWWRKKGPPAQGTR